MPFTKVGPNKYESPSGRTYDLAQVRLYYAGGGHFPGQKGMADQFPKRHNSPTAPGEAARPELESSGAINAATSPTPTSILSGSREYFGPLEYSRDDGNQEYWASDRMADRDRRRASKEFNRQRPPPDDAFKPRRK